MKTKNVDKIVLGQQDKYDFRFVGDLHYGELGFDEDIFFDLMDDAELTGKRVFILGDILTSILPSDRRFEINNHVKDFSDQLAWADSFLERYKDIIYGVFKGNHEDKLFRSHGDFLEKLCNKYDIPYYGYQINLLFENPRVGTAEDSRRGRINFYLTHGNTSFLYRAGEDKRKQINKEIKLKDSLREICEADIYIMGHAHQGILYTDPYQLRLVNENGERYEEVYKPMGEGKHYVCIPSLWRTYNIGENYANRSGYPPTEIGCVDVVLDSNLDVEDIKILVSHGGEFKVKDSLKNRRSVAKEGCEQ